jgi:hypothetical protein
MYFPDELELTNQPHKEEISDRVFYAIVERLYWED